MSFCRYITRRLLDQGVRVRTLTRSPDAEDPFGGRVEVAPLDFSGPDGLRRSMQGAGVFYNTYWVRYSHVPDHLRPRGREHQDAVRGSQERGRPQNSPEPYLEGGTVYRPKWTSMVLSTVQHSLTDFPAHNSKMVLSTVKKAHQTGQNQEPFP